MNKETLEKANKLARRLRECDMHLENIKYTQNESVVIRESNLKFNGSEASVEVPKNLFKVISKLIESEYILEIDKLKKELDEL